MAAVLPVERTELSQRIGGGDTAAFAELMRKHNRMLFRTARAILRDDAEAEDALQEAYLRVYWSIGRFRGEARLSTWLVRIVANEALARLRKSARRAQIVPISSDVETDIPSNDGPELGTQRREVRRLLEEKIDALPQAYRSVFMLRALEEFSVKETAAALDIPEATVRTRFFRARSQLREALSQEVDLDFDGAFAFAGERCDRIVAAVLARLAAVGEGLH